MKPLIRIRHEIKEKLLEVQRRSREFVTENDIDHILRYVEYDKYRAEEPKETE